MNPNYQIINKRLKESQSALEYQIIKSEKYLKNKFHFDFTIEHIPGDGFCVCTEINGGSTRQLSDCLRFISEHKKMTIDDYLLCI